MGHLVENTGRRPAPGSHPVGCGKWIGRLSGAPLPDPQVLGCDYAVVATVKTDFPKAPPCKALGKAAPKGGEDL